MAPESAVGTRFDPISHTTVAAMTTVVAAIKATGMICGATGRSAITNMSAVSAGMGDSSTAHLNSATRYHTAQNARNRGHGLAEVNASNEAEGDRQPARL
jgi:hypothetical protein